MISRAALRAIVFGLACGAALHADRAPAQTWPERPVTLVVPYAPGGNIDQAARIVARELSSKLGQQFIVESKPGAGGSLGAALVAKAKPDGYTLLVTANGPSMLNKLLYETLPYDPETDFTPIVVISDVPQALIVSPKSTVVDFKDFLAQAKQKKEAMTIGHPGIGTGAHLAALWLAKLAGIEVLPVVYRGANPIVIAVLGGEIEAGLPAYIPQVQSARTLAVTSEQRVEFLPGIPTMRENGIELVSETFTALAAPVGVPAEIVSRLNRLIGEFLKTDEAKKQLAAVGARPIGGPPDVLTERMKQERTIWGPIIKSANIKLQ